MKRKFLLAILATIFGVILAEPVCPKIDSNGPHMTNGDKAAQQLMEYRNSKQRINTLTTDYGAPVGDKNSVLTVGPRGPMLIQDVEFMESLAHFARERIPERAAHAKGAGAFGYFNVTNDITKYTRAKLFSEVGKVTPVAVRISTCAGESGSPDTIRDGHGFAVKFYTEEGNWDLLNMNIPVFFLRDPIILPSLFHAFKRNPATHLKDANMMWDFISLTPEITFAIMYVFSSHGIPYRYRYMDAHALNTFKLVNENNEPVYCKFHFKTNQGTKFLTGEEATKLGGMDPDAFLRDLYDAIANEDYPSWTMYIQVMTFEQAKTFRFNPFDPTKYWPENEYPKIEVGTMTLNENPINYFAQIEQLAFAPGRMVSGIEPSPDKVLQGRIFVYPDTQRYRLGVNFLHIPVNSATGNASVHNYERDGYFQTVKNNQGGAPNYYPNSYCGPKSNPAYKAPAFHASGDVDRWNSDDEDNFSQAATFYREVFTEDDRTALIKNLANGLIHVQQFIQKRAVSNFAKVDSDLGKRLMDEIQKMKA